MAAMAALRATGDRRRPTGERVMTNFVPSCVACLCCVPGCDEQFEFLMAFVNSSLQGATKIDNREDCKTTCQRTTTCWATCVKTSFAIAKSTDQQAGPHDNQMKTRMDVISFPSTTTNLQRHNLTELWYICPGWRGNANRLYRRSA